MSIIQPARLVRALKRATYLHMYHTVYAQRAEVPGKHAEALHLVTYLRNRSIFAEVPGFAPALLSEFKVFLPERAQPGELYRTLPGDRPHMIEAVEASLQDDTFVGESLAMQWGVLNNTPTIGLLTVTPWLLDNGDEQYRAFCVCNEDGTYSARYAEVCTVDWLGRQVDDLDALLFELVGKPGREVQDAHLVRASCRDKVVVTPGRLGDAWRVIGYFPLVQPFLEPRKAFNDRSILALVPKTQDR